MTEAAAPVSVEHAPAPVPVDAPDTSTVSDDDALGAIYDAAMKNGMDVDETAAEAPAESTVETGQQRGPDGKFIAQDKAEGEKPVEGEESSLEGEDAGAEADAAPVEAPAPAHLPQAIKASWKDIPEPARNAIAAHQTEMDRKFSEVGRQLAQVKPVSDKLTQAVEQFPQFKGMTPDRLAQGALELAAVQAELESGDPQRAVNTIMKVAQSYGALPALAAQLTGEQANPDTQALHTEIAQLRRQLGERQEQITPEFIQEQVSTTIERRDTEAKIDAFKADKEAHPFFDDVEQALPHFIAIVKERQPHGDIQTVLSAAYDMAINADPVVRQKVRDLEATKATTEQTDTKRKDAAKKAASINVKSSTGGGTRQRSEEEVMGDAYDRAMTG